jgi:hypothetical protein
MNAEIGFQIKSPLTCTYLGKVYTVTRVYDSMISRKYLLIFHCEGMPPHIDTHSCFDDFILSLSLGSSVCMDFKNEFGLRCSKNLGNKSLLIMKNESR